MITIPAEALFDILDKRKATFRDEYQTYNIEISDENVISIWEDYEPRTILITKAGFMELLLNRVFVCDEYELKIGL